MQPDNPFIISGKVPTKYFCDREDECASLLNRIRAKSNTLLISERRVGKSALIWHLYEEETLRKGYHTYYADMLPTTSLAEFVYVLGKAIFDQSKGSKTLLRTLTQTLKSLTGVFGFDPTSGLPTFTLGLGDISKPEFTLNEIFDFLESQDKRCVVAIDEFQQITEYEDKNVEALLRTHIQQATNSTFIFAGSERHLLTEMFMSSARPFYNSVSLQNLDVIAKDKYTAFVAKQFKAQRRKAEAVAVEEAYDLFEGNTFCLQKTFNRAFELTAEGGVCDRDTVAKATDSNVMENERAYQMLMGKLTIKQKQLLTAVAKEGHASKMLSEAFIREHSLGSASSVQASTKRLLGERIIVRDAGDSWSIPDRFLRIWLLRTYS